MSIHPDFAEAILNGTKTVEFRKRPIATDVTHVVLYVTQPVASVVGVFAVADQVTASPANLWKRFRLVAGISRKRFFEYYADRSHGTGIRVASVHKLSEALALDDALGIERPPQSFRYVPVDAAQRVLDLASLS